MKLTIQVRGDVAAITDAERKAIAKAATAAFRTGADKLKSRGRAAIAAGGFSGRWQNAFRVNAYPKNGNSLSPRIFGYHKIKYAGQFQEPETVTGTPYVWLPIEKNLPGGRHWTPHTYTLQIGSLKSGRHGGRPILFGQISVNSKNKPLKLTRKGARTSAVRKAWLPVFVGVRTVKDPKRFDLGQQAELTAAELGAIFSEKWNEN